MLPRDDGTGASRPCAHALWWPGMEQGEGITNLGPEHRPLQLIAPPSSTVIAYLLQAHSEVQGALTVGKWRLRTVGRVCRSVGGLQTHGVGPLPAPLGRHLFPHQCAAGESPKIPLLCTRGPHYSGCQANRPECGWLGWS